ncbi:MOSC domain-containing protein [Qaidamihabitans albus]|uniref:MOSC domain-containing protein n=1 Tax=Qaidamihabitans albus TaxID=2795733 RepID=UPI0018F1AA37|nr:MOSC N-terminal beta barrel domain-containing protein [Qaidamihabitans albus]
MARVADLITYPVKGCAGTRVQAAELAPAGLEHDRTFMAVGEDGTFRSQRRHPVLAVVRPAVLDGGARLALSAPGHTDIEVAVAFDGRRRDVSVFTWAGQGVDQGDEAAAWFSAVLGAPSRLVRVPPEHRRETSGETPGSAGFADGHAVLVASWASLDLLNERIAERGGEPVPMDRFRPNLVVDGWTEPHTEDDVWRMTAGGAELGFAKVCVRCTVPTVDQETGTRSGPEPVRTLAGYRRGPDGGVTFGMKAAVLRAGTVRIGDRVRVESRVTSPT